MPSHFVTVYDCVCPECENEAPGIMEDGVLLVPPHRLPTGITCPGGDRRSAGYHPTAGESKLVKLHRSTGLPVDNRHLRVGYDMTWHWWDGYIAR